MNSAVNNYDLIISYSAINYYFHDGFENTWIEEQKME